MALDDYYAVLHVRRDASRDDIRASYRRLMQQGGHHPDLGGDTAMAALINKAYAVLSDPPQRNAYDAQLEILRRIAAYAASRAPAAPSRLDPRHECVFCGAEHDIPPDDPDASCGNCDSPLAVVERTALDSADNRRMPRMPIDQPARFFVNWRQVEGHRARTEDLSLTGVRLVTRYALVPGQRVRVANDIIDAVGYVVHGAPRRSGWRMEHVAGIEFVTMRLLRTNGAFVSAHV